MMLIKASGLIPEKDDPKVMEILIDVARAFFKAGGILTFTDWVELSNIERIAFINARESFAKDEHEKAVVMKYVNRVHSLLSNN